MRDIRLHQISKTFDNELVLEKVSLTIPAGKFFALLGPSGCGKTTLLRLIAGFEMVDHGSIFLGDQDITQTPINRRPIHTVFQNYALFPHLNVFDNIAYSQVIKKVDPELIEQKVFKILKSFCLENHAYKLIQHLSGGQQQRVAIARAIINDPEVLLLDEPLAALDIKLRERLLVELMELQDVLKTTFVYVTHDQLEALTVADQMAIMNYDGQIEQIGTPKDIYEFPGSSFVAKFVGTTNIFEGVVTGIEQSIAQVSIDQLGVVFCDCARSCAHRVIGDQLIMSIRPEKILISAHEREGFSNCLFGTVQTIVYHGRSTQYDVKVKSDQIVRVFEQNEEHFPQQVIDYDMQVYLYWQQENMVVLER
jgi:spermidine/putrescine transport system ATP-binding protein